MKYLGLDFGEKKIGLAVSDEDGRLAFPLKILANDRFLIKEIKQICQEEKIDKIVLGKSITMTGQANLIMKDILAFKERLEKENFLVVLEDETMTSLFARLGPIGKKPKTRRKQKEKPIDAQAAALILQRYLDKINKVKE